MTGSSFENNPGQQAKPMARAVKAYNWPLQKILIFIIINCRYSCEVSWHAQKSKHPSNQVNKTSYSSSFESPRPTHFSVSPF